MTRRRDTRSMPKLSAASEPKPLPPSRMRFFAYLALSALVIAGVALAAVYFLSLDDTVPATGSDNAASAAFASADSTPAPVPTSIPPTEPSEEIEVQDALQSWFATVAGVTNVRSLDIDVPAGEPPLVYAEIDVEPGYSGQQMAETFVTKLNEVLGVTRYSDLVIIIDDGAQVIEYTFDSDDTIWHETLLASNALSLSHSMM